MLNFLRRIFRFLFGGNDDTTPPTDSTNVQTQEPETTKPEEAVQKPETQNTEKPQNGSPEKEVEPDITVNIPEGTLAVDLVRFDYGEKDTLGRLFIDGKFQCYTMEGEYSAEKNGAFPKGSYGITLHTEGGRHATYSYRFKELHHGMLYLKDLAGISNACIHIGNRAADIQNSVIVGTQIVREGNHREVWHSDKAYMKIYKVMADSLLAGKSVVLRIS